ncbi:MAG: asparagine synthase-related protein [Actinomycetaceae bacterium]|nr:asparagine synthase-related protein [Actinomycetaceae bacterium]
MAPKILLTSPLWHANEDTKEWNHFPSNQPVDWDSLSTRPGQWTLIRQLGDDIQIAADRTRSHPIAYAFAGGNWVVTDDVNKLRSFVPWELDEEPARVFRDSAFTLENRTLIRGVYSTEAATITTLHADGRVSSEPYMRYRLVGDGTEITTDAEYDEAFSNAMDAALTRLLDAAGNRQLVLPLSGGLDSRLLAAWLKRLDAPNVAAFTYGKAGSREVEVSRQVAENLGIKWQSVETPVQQVRSAWRSSEAADFVQATWKGTSLPHVQDWYALRTLRAGGLLEEDAIILPGHTIVGNMHHEHLADGPVDRAKIVQAMISHHLTLNRNHPKSASSSHFVHAVQSAFAQTDFPNTPRATQTAIEWFNLRERQAKYINNSMAGYEFFGYSWALPMLDPEFWEVWQLGSPRLTVTRDWYARFTEQIFSEQAGTSPKLFTARSLMKPSALKSSLLTVMRATRADKALSRYRSTKTMLDHPMSFEAYTRKPRKTQAVKHLLGTTQMGLWTGEFLDNSWTTDREIVPTGK